MARVGTASKNTWGFAPITIPNCSLWLDAADTTTLFTDSSGTVQAVVGDRIQYWKDKSPSGTYALQTTLANRPTLQTEPIPGLAPQTNLTSLNFTGSPQVLALPNASMLPLGTSDGTYFIVCRTSTSVTASTNMAPFSYGGGSNTATSSPSRYFIVTPTTVAGFVCTQLTAFSAVNTYIPTLITGGIKDYIIYSFVNGSTAAANNLQNLQGGPFVTSGGTLSTNALIGTPNGTGVASAFIGNVCEIIVFNRSIENYERQQVEGYLAYKWGITPILPETNHPYYNTLERGFTPYLAGGSLRLWLDASTLSGANGSAITTWSGLNFGGSVNNGLSDSTTAPTLATNSLNGRNTVVFNGTQFMDISNSGVLASSSSSLDMLFVAQTTNATPAPARQTVFTQGGVAYPNILNAAGPSATEGYFNSSNQLSFDTLGVPSGTIPTSTTSYTNKYVVGFVRVSGGIIGPTDNGNTMPSNSYTTTTLLRQTARLGASRKLSTMRVTGTAANPVNTVTVEVLTGGPPCVNQVFFVTAAVGGLVTLDSAQTYYITNVTGTGPSYTITVSTTYDGASPSLSSTTSQTVAAQAFTTINATTTGTNTVTLTSSTPPTVNQPIIFASSVGGINARGRYYIKNILDSTNPPSYIVQLSSSIGGPVFPITLSTTNQGVPELLVDNYLTGNIAEIIYFINFTLSTALRQRFEGYLAWKWGLQANLPTSHPYYLANYFYNSTRPSSRMFAPTDIEGCQLWIDPTDLETVGYPISAWNDSTTNSNNVTQNTTTLHPYYVPSQRGIYFGTTEFLSFSNLDLFRNIGYASLYIVMRVPSGTPQLAQNDIFVATTPSAGTSRFSTTIIPQPATVNPPYVYGGVFRRTDADTASTLNSGIAYPYDGITILNIEVNYSTNTYTVSRNGTQDNTITSAGLTSGLTSNTASSSISISTPITASRLSNFYIHEILLYTSSGTALSSPQRDDNHGYLAWKWGIQNSLPNTNRWSPFASPSATIGPSTPVTGSIVWLDAADSRKITATSSVGMLTDKSGTDNAAVNNASTLTLTTYTKPDGSNTLPVLVGSSSGSGNSLTTRTIPARDTSNHTYAFVVKYPATGNSTSNTVLSFTSTPITTTLPSIPGIALWLDAADASTVAITSGNVTGWTDKAFGYTSTASNTTAIQYIPNASNGLPVIRIGSTPAYFTFGNINNIGTQEFNIFAVFKASTITSVNSIIGKGSATTTGWWFGYNQSGSALQTQYGGGNIGYTNTSGFTNYTIVSSMNPRTSGNTHYYNGTLLGTGSINSTSLTNTSNLRVGSQDNNFTVTNTDFAEIIMYIGSISTTQRQQIEGYLAQKWGLKNNLPTGHPYAVQFGNVETFGHGGTSTNPTLDNFNNIPGGVRTYSPYNTVANADAFYGGNTFVCMCVRQNGVWRFTTNGVNYGTISPYALKKLSSGTYSFGVNNNSSIQLGDVIVYNNAISVGEQQQLEGYLAWKWGLQRTGNSNVVFPSTHPYYNYPPSTTTPIVNANQYYKKTFDITDLAPVLWLDANDPNTYNVDANNRVQWITNKGLFLKSTFNITAVSGSNFTVSSTANLSPGQAFEIASANIAITGIPTIVSTTTSPVFFYVLTVSGSIITISSTFGGSALSGTFTSSTPCYISQRFTKPVGTSSGVGLNGPLLTQSAVGTGNGLNYLDFSSGGTFKITSASTNVSGTSVTLTLNTTHNIPATRQVRVVVSSGTYSTDASSATGITGTYTVSSQTGTTITIPYTSSKVSATVNNIVGYVEYGSILIQDISMASGVSTAVFTTSFPHGLTTSDSIFLSLAGSTITNFPVALNLANGVYTPSAVSSTTFTITSLLNLGGSPIVSDGTITNTSLVSNTSPSYAYFPYNGYCLESRSASGMIASSAVNVFIVTHTNPNSSGLGASSIARCGRNVETQPPILATAATVDAASGEDLNGIATAAVFGIGRDFNVRLANYNAVGNQLTRSTVPSVRLGVKRNQVSITSAALTDTSRSVTNTTNGFRLMSAFVMPNGATLEQTNYSTSVTSCGWKPTSGNDTVGITSTATPLMNTVYANNTTVLPVYQVSSTGTGSIATATFLPYGIEPTYTPYYAGQPLNIFGLGASGYNNASATATGPTSTTVTYNTTSQQAAGTITGLAGTINLATSTAQVPVHIRIGADTNATTSYSTSNGYITDRFFDGGIAEILVISGIITAEQRMLVEGYLAQKYNFQDYLGATTNTITNSMAFAVGTTASNVTCTGTTATIIFTNPYTVNPFIPGSRITVAGTISTAGYTGTFIIVSVSGTNQVSYSVASTLSNPVSISGVTVTSARTQNNLFIHPYTSGPANIASNLALNTTLTQNLALWYDAATYSSLGLSGSSVTSWASRLGNIAYASNIFSPVNASFRPKYTSNSLNGLPGIEFMTSVYSTDAILTSIDSSNRLTVTSSTPIVANQLFNVLITTSGIDSTQYYFVRSDVTSVGSAYTFTISTTLNGSIFSVTSGTPNVSVRIFATLTGIDGSNRLTVTSSTPIVANQIINVLSTTSNIASSQYYSVRNDVTSVGNAYTFTISATLGGVAASVTTGSPNVGVRIFTGGTMFTPTGGITGSSIVTSNSNSEFVYFFVLKRNSTGVVNASNIIVSLNSATGNTSRINLTETLFSMIDIQNNANTTTNTLSYATRGGIPLDTPIILSVYKRGRDVYSRIIGGGRTSTFVQTFSKDNQVPPVNTFQISIGTSTGTANTLQFNGTLYEMMFFRDALTDQAIQQTEGYLAQKWGLRSSLPPTHSCYNITA